MSALAGAGRAVPGVPSLADVGRAVPGVPSLADADWSAPWLAAVADEARGIDWRDPAAALVALSARAAARGLASGAGCALRFVDAGSVRADAYERHIGDTGCVPTRLQGEGFVHDALNALAWLRFPRIKAALNAAQAGEIARAGVAPARGALRDAATLFDENALLLVLRQGDAAAAAAAQALRVRDWKSLFLGHRAAWHDALVPVAFGHALQQKLLAPFKAITAHAWLVELPGDWFELALSARCARLDEAFGAGLAARLVDRARRAPLPVLGIPGWWPGNRADGFYDDEVVFRAPRG